jgi:hypothetical protein
MKIQQLQLKLCAFIVIHIRATWHAHFSIRNFFSHVNPYLVKKANYEAHSYVFSLSITLRKTTRNSDYQVSRLRIEMSTFRREFWSLASGQATSVQVFL